MEPLQAISLFSGIEGFGLGLERAEMRVVAQVEVDRDCRRQLARRYPDVPRFADIREVDPRDLPAADLVCGGFPCQDLSVAGRRAGLGGERSSLWWEFWRVVAAVRPRWVVVENVPGLLSAVCPDPDATPPPDPEPDGGFRLVAEEWDERADRGPGACPGGCMAAHGGAMGLVLGSLAGLGYGHAYRVLDAQHFGLAQRRRRVFIVCRLGDGAAPVEVLLEPEGGEGDPAAGRAQGKGVAASLTAGVAAARGVNPPGQRAEDDVNLAYSESGQGWWRGGIGPLRNRAGAQHEATVIAGPLGGGNNGIGRRTEDDPNLVVAPLTAKWAKGNGGPAGDEVQNLIAHTAEGADASEDGTGRGTPLVAVRTAQTSANGHGLADEVAHTLDGANGQAIAGTAVRRLTPVECERLQGFPDNWTAGQADSVRYRQLGNAVPVPVAEWIGRRIVAVEEAELAASGAEA